MPKSALPPHLQNKRHNDFPWPLKWIPRSWTAFDWELPELVKGHLNPEDYTGPGQYHPKPITSPGTWQISYFPSGPWFAWYFAFTTKSGVHFRIGARWDDVDFYTEFPTIAIKRGIT